MRATDKQEVQIRERAYHLWETEGYPQGRDLEHWFRAERELQGTAPAKGNAARSRKRPSPASSRRGTSSIA